MPAPLSKQLCQRIVRRHAVDNHSNAEIARALRVDPKTVAAVLRRWRNGDALHKTGRSGIVMQRTKFHRAGAWVQLKRILGEYECAYLDEIADELRRRTGVDFSCSTVCRAIKAMGWTNKKVGTAAVLCRHMPLFEMLVPLP